ncbi:TetR/AcrR family transcriptional regulator [Xanthobacter sp. VTT E-85241]|uniref:TetR/AcrR family transcriptional regulator n=1 Tax=Roseixanthobacter finlandensis TaxID=3119922 RepID=UPI003726B042
MNSGKPPPAPLGATASSATQPGDAPQDARTPQARDAPDTKLAARDPRGTGRRIRAAARRLFLERGYGNTSMDAVAAAAPASKRTLYQHYPSKAELFGAVIAEVWAHFIRGPDLPDTAEEDPRFVLREFVARMCVHWDQPDVIPILRLIIAEAPRFPELSEAFARTGKEPTLRKLTAYLEMLRDAGKLPAGLDTSLAAAQFLGAIKEPLFWPRVLASPIRFSIEAVTDRAIAEILRN